MGDETGRTMGGWRRWIYYKARLTISHCPVLFFNKIRVLMKISFFFYQIFYADHFVYIFDQKFAFWATFYFYHFWTKFLFWSISVYFWPKFQLLSKVSILVNFWPKFHFLSKVSILVNLIFGWQFLLVMKTKKKTFPEISI